MAAVVRVVAAVVVVAVVVARVAVAAAATAEVEGSFSCSCTGAASAAFSDVAVRPDKAPPRGRHSRDPRARASSRAQREHVDHPAVDGVADLVVS